jgi:5-formyltetrahydrofolate cyclo-ligase
VFGYYYDGSTSDPRIVTRSFGGCPRCLFPPSGVGFDRSLARLGHGKGYYDRFLSSYSTIASARGRAKPLFGELPIHRWVILDKASELLVPYHAVFPTAVALALREQVLDAGEVPVGANDVSVDMIVTPDETIAGTSE